MKYCQTPNLPFQCFIRTLCSILGKDHSIAFYTSVHGVYFKKKSSVILLSSAESFKKGVLIACLGMILTHTTFMIRTKFAGLHISTIRLQILVIHIFYSLHLNLLFVILNNVSRISI